MLVNNICQDDQIPNPTPNFLINQTHVNDFSVTVRGMSDHELPRPPVINRRENHVILLFSLLLFYQESLFTTRGHNATCFFTLFFFLGGKCFSLRQYSLEKWRPFYHLMREIHAFFPSLFNQESPLIITC